MRAATRVIRFLDEAIDTTIIIIIIIILLFCTYALWDELQIVHDPVIDKIVEHKPIPGPEPTLTELREINKDVICWLELFETSIDYPVVQSRDNEEYVYKDFYGNYSYAGTVFLDYRNKPDFTDTYNICYGHNIYLQNVSDVMFTDVMFYASTDDSGEYFNNHVKGALTLDSVVYDLEAFAVVYEDGTSSLFNNTFYQDRTLEFIDDIHEKAIHWRELEWEPDDRVLALSTCHSGVNMRNKYVLFCKILDVDEHITEDIPISY